MNSKCYKEFENIRWNYWMKILFNDKDITNTDINNYMEQFSKLNDNNGNYINKYLIYDITTKNSKKVVHTLIYTGLQTKYDVNVECEGKLIGKKLNSNDSMKQFYDWNNTGSINNVTDVYGNYTDYIKTYENYWKDKQTGWSKPYKINNKIVKLKHCFEIDIYRYGLGGKEEIFKNGTVLSNRKYSIINKKRQENKDEF